MPRISRGCLRCRERRVKCDEARPVCRRCTGRGEVCVGYRDESDIIFRHQTQKVVAKATGQPLPLSSPELSASPSTVSVSGLSSVGRTLTRRVSLDSLSQYTTPAITPSSETPAFKQLTGNDGELQQVQEQAVSEFFERYVMYPGKNSKSGFLEHLPCLFQEVNVDGRCALRWAVQAAALADASRGYLPGSGLATQALDSYGKALAALSVSLSEQGKTPDDYELMTIVVLDIFEAIFLPDDTRRGAHVPGIAHILRLRGTQFHNPRGWSLFRLAHHQMQKQQLGFHIAPMKESGKMLDQLTDGLDSIHLEKDALQISTICERARNLVKELTDTEMSVQQVVDLVREMQALDQKAVLWRQGPQWAFRTVRRDELTGSKAITADFPDRIEIHPDVWSAYEWNYHRAARLTLHEQLLTCLRRASTASALLENSDAAIVAPLVVESITIIRSLTDKVLATVPQTLGDLDDAGRVRDPSTPRPKTSAVGAYLLLWPIKIIKAPQNSASEEQKAAAQAVFEKIREYTGAKLLLGDLSST